MEQEEQKAFDTRTHIRDPKTGEVVKQNHYTYHVSKAGEFYKRDGKRFHANGDPVEELSPQQAQPSEPVVKPTATESKAAPVDGKKKRSKPKAKKALDKPEN